MALQTVPPGIKDDGKFRAVASGTLPSGQPVVVNSDGTVSVVGETSFAQALGSPVVFESATTYELSVAYDSNAQRVVVAYNDGGNSFFGTAVVGTVSGTSISFGTPVVFESAETNDISAVYDASAQKIVIAYRDSGNSQYGTALVGTVSGTSITFGTPVVFESAFSTNISATYDANAQKIVVAYRDIGNSNFGTGIVGSISGNSISFGSPTVFENADSRDISAVYDSSAQKVVIAYRDRGNLDYGTAKVATVSGTSISFGSASIFSSSYSYYIGTTYDSVSGKVVVAYSDAGNLGYGTAVVGTVSGTSISFGTPVVFNTSDTVWIEAQYDSQAGLVTIAYQDAGNANYGTFINGTISGTSINFSTEVVFEAADTDYIAMTHDSVSNKVVIAYRDNATTPAGYGTAIMLQNAASVTNLTASNFIGFSADGNVADTGNAVVNVVNCVADGQTGLTTGAKYYVQTDGTLSTTPGTPSVFAGTAISATNILVKT